MNKQIAVPQLLRANMAHIMRFKMHTLDPLTKLFLLITIKICNVGTKHILRYHLNEYMDISFRV